MTTIWVSLLTLIGGAVASGVLTYVGTRRKLSLDYDADLRKRRIRAYQDLWKRLEPLSKYVPATFSGTDADDLAKSMSTWYFHNGGLFLSTAARNDCFALQDILRYITDGWGWETPDRLSLTPAAREILRTYGSRLRTGLTLDVGTRSRPKMKGYVEPVNRQLEGIYEREGNPEKIRLEFSPRFLGGTRRVYIKTVNDSVENTILTGKLMPSRMVIRVILKGRDGSPLEREFLMEGGKIVEGPSRNEENAQPPAIWRRIPFDNVRADRLSSTP
jgi:hypothetical protein